MNDILYYTIIYIIEAVIFYLYCCHLFTHVRSRLTEIPLIFVCYLLLIPGSLLYNPLLNTLGFAVINVILLYAVKKLNIGVAIFHAFFLTALMCISELLIVILIPHLYIKGYRNTDTLNNSDLLYLILNKTIYLILSQFVCCFMKDKSATRESTRGTYYLSSISVISAVIMVFLIIICLNVSMPEVMLNILILCALLLLILTILVFAMQTHYQHKSLEYSHMQLQLQKEYDTAQYYRMIVAQEEKQHILIHDIKKHLNTIAALNQEKDTLKVDNYIRNMLNSDALKVCCRLSDNNTMNIILSRYVTKCKENNITFIADIRSNTLSKFEDNDLTSLFCNLLDNAYTAASAARTAYDSCITREAADPEWEDAYAAFIELRVKHVENSSSILITLTNSCDSDPFSPDGRLYTTKNDKEFHGYGINSIHGIVDKYNGIMEQYYKEDSNEFHTIIHIN